MRRLLLAAVIFLVCTSTYAEYFALNFEGNRSQWQYPGASVTISHRPKTWQPGQPWFKIQSSSVTSVTLATALKALPQGKRALRVNGLDYQIYQHPDDRCVSTTAFSKNPTPSGGWGWGPLAGTPLGEDGLNSGYSFITNAHWKKEAKAVCEALADQLKANGASIDYLVLDTEQGLSEWSPLGASKVWQRLIIGDPRFPPIRAKLDALVRARLKNPKAYFPTSADGFDENSPYWSWTDWDAQMKDCQNSDVSVIWESFRRAFPTLKCSQYGAKGHRMGDGCFDVNGHLYYDLSIVGTHASQAHYGWVRKASLTTGGDAWGAFLFEQNNERGTIRAGFPSQPWIAYPTFKENCRFDADYGTPYPWKPNLYWMENIRHLAMLGADPFLYFNPRKDVAITSVSLNTNSIAFGWRPDRYLSVIRILNSANNNGVYSILKRTTESKGVERYFLKEKLKSALVDGAVQTGSSAECDTWLDKVLEEINLQVPSRLQTIFANPIVYQDDLIISGIRHENLATYRISINRKDAGLPSAPWSNFGTRGIMLNAPVTLTIHEKGQPPATRTIPAGEVGIWYTTGYREGTTFTLTASQ